MSKSSSNLPKADKPEFHNYVIGEVYFFVTFPDSEMRYPVVETYVFLGMNFSDEDWVNTWYFQPILDFCEFGSAMEGTERSVFCATSEQLDEFQNITQLTHSLSQAADRRTNNTNSH